MEAVAVIALILAVMALAVAGLAWQQARKVRVMTERTKQRPRSEVDAGSRPSAAPAPSVATAAMPQTAPLDGSRPTSVHDAGEAGNGSGATIVVRPGSTAGEALPTNQGVGTGLIGIFLYNRRPAVAHDLQLVATFPGRVIRQSSAQRTLSARKEVTLFVQILARDFNADGEVDVVYCIRYRDVNGQHELLQPVRLEGGWKGPWATYVQDGPGLGTAQRLSRVTTDAYPS